MSAEYKVGDVVDITIKGAKVSDVSDYGAVLFTYGGHYLATIYPAAVTITRVAPAVAAGDVWRLPSGREIAIFDETAEYRVRSICGDMRWFSPDDLDFTDAELLFRLTAAGAPAMLQRFEDNSFGLTIWIETAPGSGEYRPVGGGITKTRDAIISSCGFSRDLAPIPAEAAPVGMTPVAADQAT